MATAITAEYTQFLNILMTQLKNQNPLDPTDPTEFTSQLAQFSALEQQINTNTKLDALVSASSATNFSPVSYLGTTVDYEGSTVPVQDGTAVFTYSSTGAKTVTLKVTDADGNVVYTATGDATSGTHELKLATDGDADGAQLTLTVTATDADGASVDTVVGGRARITAVNIADGTAILEASGYEISSDVVTRIATTTVASDEDVDTTA